MHLLRELLYPDRIQNRQKFCVSCDILKVKNKTALNNVLFGFGHFLKLEEAYSSVQVN